MNAQRLRVTFSRGEEVKYITHLDLMRFWERALRRASVPLAYSGGATPTPRISLAAPLPLGVTSACELMDIFLSERLALAEFGRRVKPQLVPGIDVLAAREVGTGLPALQTRVRWAEYQVGVPLGRRSRGQMLGAIAALLAADSLPWEHLRDGKPRRYDLRPLVLGLWLDDVAAPTCVLGMRLRIDPSAAGRAEQVTAALGVAEPPAFIHRTKLYIDETSPVEQAFRRRGQRQG